MLRSFSEIFKSLNFLKIAQNFGRFCPRQFYVTAGKVLRRSAKKSGGLRD